MAYVKVKNKIGTSRNVPPNGFNSWLEYWEKKKGKTATQCEVNGCGARNPIGGHVYKAGEGGKEYILPICKTCNNKPDDEEFEAWDTDLVSVS